MKRSLFVVVLFAVVSSQVCADNSSTYAVNRILDVAPTADGVVTEGEWDVAAPAAGNWVDLNTGALDAHNLRFRLLWDDQNLYILGETDFTGFAPPSDDFDDPNTDGFTYNPSFYIDPNTDGEDLSSGRTDDTVDGYQVSWSMDEGFTSRAPTVGEPDRSLRDPKNRNGLLINDYIAGLHLEAHVNTPFGNNGGWERSDDGPNENYRDDTHQGLVFGQNADNFNVNGTGVGGGVFEWSIAWSELNATDPNKLLSEADGDAVLREIEDPFDPSQLIDNPNFLGDIGDPDPRYADPESEFFLENGLYAPSGPADDDVWAFEFGVITPDTNNAVVSWSMPIGGDETRTELAAWGSSGHGQIIFLGEPDVPVDPAVPFDCNADGALDNGDLVCVTSETVDETLEALNLLAGDLNGDAEVAFSDFLTLSSNFGNTEDTNYPTGDINVDGEVAFADFLTISSNFGKTPDGGDPTVPEDPTVPDDPAVPFDCNEDGALDNGDLVCVTSETVDGTLEALNLLAGDLNGDAEVAFSDFLTLSSNFGNTEDTNYTTGDINVDGEVAFADFLTISSNFGETPGGGDPTVPEDPTVPDDPAVPFDCNEDGALDNGDLMCVTSETVDETLEALNLLAGDLNGDGEVAFSDFLTVSSNFGNTEDTNYTTGDTNVDGEVAFADFLTISSNFGNTPAAAAAAVPEPSGFTLLLLGCFALVRRSRR